MCTYLSTSMVCGRLWYIVTAHSAYTLYTIFFRKVLNFWIWHLFNSSILWCMSPISEKISTIPTLKSLYKIANFILIHNNYNFSGEKQMVWPLWQEEWVHWVLLKVLPPVELEEEPVSPAAGIPRPVCPGVCEGTGGTLPTNSAPSNPPGCVHWELVSCEYFLRIYLYLQHWARVILSLLCSYQK